MIDIQSDQLYPPHLASGDCVGVDAPDSQAGLSMPRTGRHTLQLGHLVSPQDWSCPHQELGVVIGASIVLLSVACFQTGDVEVHVHHVNSPI